MEKAPPIVLEVKAGTPHQKGGAFYERKIITAIVTGLLVLSLGTGAMAASQGHGGGGCQGQYFVDEDGDGVCDNLGTGKGQAGRAGTSWIEDGDGVCDNLGTGRGQGGQGRYFVDEDGDGVL